MKAIVYRDLKRENRHGYELIGELQPDTMVVSEMIVPGAFGYPPLYVRHINFMFGEQPFLLISQTDYELDRALREEIVAGAGQFLASA